MPEPDPRRVVLNFSAPAFGLGGAAAGIQVFLLREFGVQFQGNELVYGLVLAAWLMWGGLGSLRASNREFSGGRLSALFLLALIGSPVSFILLRSSRWILGLLPGETIGLWPVLLFALAATFFVNYPLGKIFVAASREAGSVAAAYAWESLGAAFSGGFAYLILIRFLSNWRAAGALGVIFAFVVLFRDRDRRAGTIPLAAAALVLNASLIIADAPSQRIFWRPYSLIEAADSAYGNWQVIRTAEQLTFYDNGLKAYSHPDPASAEEAVHFAMLQHPAARGILLIGGGASGSLVEILKYPASPGRICRARSSRHPPGRKIPDRPGGRRADRFPGQARHRRRPRLSRRGDATLRHHHRRPAGPFVGPDQPLLYPRILRGRPDAPLSVRDFFLPRPVGGELYQPGAPALPGFVLPDDRRRLPEHRDRPGELECLSRFGRPDHPRSRGPLPDAPQVGNRQHLRLLRTAPRPARAGARPDPARDGRGRRRRDQHRPPSGGLFFRLGPMDRAVRRAGIARARDPGPLARPPAARPAASCFRRRARPRFPEGPPVRNDRRSGFRPGPDGHVRRGHDDHLVPGPLRIRLRSDRGPSGRVHVRSGGGSLRRRPPSRPALPPDHRSSRSDRSPHLRARRRGRDAAAPLLPLSRAVRPGRARPAPFSSTPTPCSRRAAPGPARATAGT